MEYTVEDKITWTIQADEECSEWELGDDTDLNDVFLIAFFLVSLAMLKLLMNIIPLAILLITARFEMAKSMFSMRMSRILTIW